MRGQPAFGTRCVVSTTLSAQYRFTKKQYDLQKETVIQKENVTVIQKESDPTDLQEEKAL